jgi:hypothetical protein
MMAWVASVTVPVIARVVAWGRTAGGGAGKTMEANADDDEIRASRMIFDNKRILPGIELNPRQGHKGDVLTWSLFLLCVRVCMFATEYPGNEATPGL